MSDTNPPSPAPLDDEGPRTPRPALDWDADGTPRARGFADAYFDRADPVGETRHVFLEGCGLPDGWAGRSRFTIGETGFGTGLNFLLAAKLWAQTSGARPVGASLSFVSIEGFPISVEELARAHARLPDDLQPLAARLRADWPPPYRGRHMIRWPDLGIELTLAFEPVAAALDGLEAPVDAWFLDGFAPARNPEMWGEPVLTRITALSRPCARLASFTAAGAVRRTLEGLGADVTRRPGFAAKRHCIAARAPDGAPSSVGSDRPPWARRPPTAEADAEILVLGGGIAARWTTAALAEAGLRPLRLGPAAGDPPPRALIAPKLVRGTNAYARISVLAFLHAVAALDRLAEGATGIWRARGVAAPGVGDDLAAALDWPETLLRRTDEGLCFPRAGVIDPAAVHRALETQAAAAGARSRTGEAARIERRDGLWRALDADGRVLAAAERMLIAAGPASLALIPAGEDVAPVRFAGGRLFLPHATADFPSQALAYGGFVSGDLGDGRALLGASARNADDPDAARALETGAVEDSWRRCLDRLAPMRPALADRLRGTAAPESWVGVRATTPDHLPLAGPVPAPAAFIDAFAAYARGARAALPEDPDATMQPGLLLLTALGARGYQLAPLLADDLAQQLTGRPGALSAADRAALHPARFLMRAMSRGEVRESRG